MSYIECWQCLSVNKELYWELITPGFSAQWKEQVPFKTLYTKRIYFSFELHTINTNPKVTRISNIPLRSVGSNRELLTEWKSKTATASNWISLLVITNSPYTVLRIFTPMVMRWSLYTRFVENLVGRTLGSLRGLRESLGSIKLFKNVKTTACVRCPGICK